MCSLDIGAHYPAQGWRTWPWPKELGIKHGHDVPLIAYHVPGVSSIFQRLEELPEA